MCRGQAAGHQWRAAGEAASHVGRQQRERSRECVAEGGEGVTFVENLCAGYKSLHAHHSLKPYNNYFRWELYFPILPKRKLIPWVVK